MDGKELQLYLKKPKEVRKDGANEVYVFENIEVNVKGGKVDSWKETRTIVPNALDDAYSSYLKALELDVEKKNEKKIIEGLKSLKNNYKGRAVNCFSVEDYACSADAFKKMVEISELKQINEKDTSSMYNAGFTAMQAGRNDEAISYLSKVASMNYKGDPFLYPNLKKAYIAKGDSASALKALKQGFELFPNDLSIIIELVNFYIFSGNKDAALEYLAKAKQADPKNKSFYYAEGVLFDNMASGVEDKLIAIEKQKADELAVLDENKKAEFRKTGNNVQKYKPIDEKYQKLKKAVEDKYNAVIDSINASYVDSQNKAAEQYKKATELDPSYFEAYYNLGRLYYNNGAKLSEQAGKEIDDKKYEAKKNAADEEFKKSIPFMESAYEANEKTKVTPENANEVLRNRKATLEILRTLYYRLKMNDQFDRVKKLLDAANSGQ